MSFIFPYLLWLLPLASLPILFHLFNRRRYKTVNFSSLKFFLKIESTSLKKISIINILLLIIRTLILLCLILMLSRPVINSSYMNSTNHSEDSILLILIDDSFSNSSMIKNDINKTINKIINVYNPLTQLEIYTSTENREHYTGLIKNYPNNSIKIDYKYNSTNIDDITSIIKDDKYNSYVNKTLLTISDFQKNFIENNNFKESIYKDWEVILYKYKKASVNLSISHLDIKNEIIIPNDIINISAFVQNHSNTNFQNRVLNLFINNIKVGSKSFDINENESKTISFKTSVPNTGFHNGYIEINTDAIEDDNKYYFTLHIPNNNSIGIITNSIENSYFLTNALDVINSTYNNLSYSIFTSDTYFETNTEHLNTLFIIDENVINENILKKKLLKNIIFIPGKQNNFNDISNILNNDSFNKSKYISLKNNNFLEIQNNNSNNIFNDLFTDSNEKRNIKVFNYHQIPSSKNTLLKLSNNDSFLDKFTVNNKNLYIFTASLNLLDTNFPIKGTFIPLLLYLVNEASSTYNFINYEGLGYDYSIKKIINPENVSYLGTNNIFSQNPYIIPGLYKNITNTNDTIYKSININKSEFENSYLKNQIKDLTTIENTFDKFIELKNHISNSLYGYELWRIILYLLIILIIIEMFLSNIYIHDKKK